jgi:hypothetical protein
MSVATFTDDHVRINTSTPDASLDSTAAVADRLRVRLTVAGIFDWPLLAWGYFDLIAGWLKQPLSLRQQHRLRQYCPDLHCQNIVADFDHCYRQRLQLKQPNEAAVRLVMDYSDDQMLLNSAEIALDLLPADCWAYDDLLVVFWNGFRQPWNQCKEMQSYPLGFSTRPYRRGYSKRGHYFRPYADQPCRIDGHPYCLHVQSCRHGAQFVRRAGSAGSAGIHRLSDLLRFDFVSYWDRWMPLYDLDYERLGRFDHNRHHGSRRSKPRLEQWHPLLPVMNLDSYEGYLLWRILSFDESSPDENHCHSLQHFVNAYGGGPFLTRRRSIRVMPMPQWFLRTLFKSVDTHNMVSWVFAPPRAEAARGYDDVRENHIMDDIRIRRRLHRQRQRHLAEMQPLQFTSDRSALDVHTVSIFDDHDGSIAIAFVTGRGTVTVSLPPHLAAETADGVRKLIWQRRVVRFDGDPVDS